MTDRGPTSPQSRRGSRKRREHPESGWSRWWPALVAVCLLSLAGNLLALRAGYGTYRLLYLIKLDPAGLDRFPSEGPPHLPDTKRVILYGDSRTVMWSPPDVPGFEFINRGISGETSAESVLRFERHVARLQPDIVVIQVGINDMMTLGLFSDDPSAGHTLRATCAANLEALVTASRALGAEVILTTLVPPARVPLWRRPFWSSEIPASVGAINAHVRSLAARDVQILDAAELLSGEQGDVLSHYSADLLHFTPEGYAVLSQALIDILTRPPQAPGGGGSRLQKSAMPRTALSPSPDPTGAEGQVWTR
jgi:lysophospholipase L1-like esterase